MSVVTRLQIAGCGMHLADQIALIGVPLAAALAFGASAEVIGVLVACQSLAHLLGSIPAYWEAGKQQMYRRMGNPTTPEGQAILLADTDSRRFLMARRLALLSPYLLMEK